MLVKHEFILGNMDMDENVEENKTPHRMELLQELACLPPEEMDNLLSGFGYSRAPWLRFFQSEQGNRIADKGMALIESFTARNHKSDTYELVAKLVAVIVIVLGIIILSHLDKFDPSIGVLFGTIIGYLFSKKAKDI